MKWMGVAFLCLAIVLPGCASGGATGNTSSSMRAQNANDDATITARVKTVLLNDPQINATKIDVATSGGVVTMSGTVKAPQDVDRAVQLARGVEGVRDVKANLQVGGH
jgi:hyperosmotically inducible periplasmic protein